MSNELAIYGRNHVMVDIETLSTNQNAAVVQIGAVKFTFEDGLGEEFIMNINPMDCVSLGLHVSESTINWWKEQPIEVRRSWQKNPQPLKTVLTEFNDFVGTDSKQWLWAHGIAFDLGVIRNLFEITNIERNWKYWCEMDNRTIYNLLNIDNRTLRKGDTNYHNALADAKSQALNLIEALTN